MFGFGGITASSSSSESQFNDLKTRVLSHEQLPMRVDKFLQVHIDSCEGAIRLVAAKILNNSSVIEKININNFEESSGSVDKITSVNEFPNSECIACRNEDYPTGVHRCVLCKKAIHILSGCSFPQIGATESDEGNGEKKICFACFNTNRERHEIIVDSNQDLLDGHVVENWKNLGLQKTKKRPYYLGTNPDFVHVNLRSRTKCKVIGVLRNGSTPSFQPIKLKNKDTH